MPLKPETVSILMDGELNTKVSEKLIPEGNFLELENGEYTETGTIRKRNGYDVYRNRNVFDADAYSSGTETIGTIDTDTIVHGFEFNGGVVALGYDYAYEFSPTRYGVGSEPVWIRNNGLDFAKVTESPGPSVLLNDSATDFVKGYDQAVNGNYLCYAWLDTNASPDTIYATIIDEDSGTTIVNKKTVHTNTSLRGVKVVPDILDGNKFSILHSDGAAIYKGDISVSGAVTSSASLITVDSAVSIDFDVIAIPSLSTYAIAYCEASSDSNHVHIESYNAAWSMLDSIDVGSATSSDIVRKPCLVYNQIQGYNVLGCAIWIAASGYATAVMSVYAIDLDNMTSALDSLSSSSITGAGTAVTDYSTICGAPLTLPSFTDIADDAMVFIGNYYYTYPSGNTYYQNVEIRVFYETDGSNFDMSATSTINSLSAPQTLVYDMYQVGDKTFALMQAVADSSLFLARYIPQDSSGNLTDPVWRVTAKMFTSLMQTTFEHTLSNTRPKTVLSASGKYTNIVPIGPTGGEIQLVRVDVEHDPAGLPVSKRFGQNQVICTGANYLYDGRDFFESSFWCPPYIPYSTFGNSGSLNDATYIYAVVYEYTDAYGQVHHSAPSVTGTTAISGTSNSGDLTIVATMPFLTSKPDDVGSIYAKFYVSAADGAIMYLAGKTRLNPTTASVTAKNITTVDTTAEQLYTGDGSLSSLPTETTAVLAAGNSRIFNGGMIDDSIFQFSNELLYKEGMETNPLLQGKLDSEGGPITGIAYLDGKVILFKRNRIYYFAGQGPNRKGLQNSFTNPQLLIAGVGCTNQKSIAEIDFGIVFQAEAGIHLLDRSLQVVYLGAPVEAYKDLTITGATVVGDKKQIRFLTSEGPMLVFDYYHKKWSTFTGLEGSAAFTWNNKYTVINDEGNLYQENTSSYSDGGSYVPLNITTAWLKLTALQQYKRLYRIGILGEYYSPHTMSVQLAYDYRDTYEQTYDYTHETFTTFGSGSYFGDQVLFGDVDDNHSTVYQFKINPDMHRCQAVKLKITDVPGATYGKAYTIDEIALSIGVLPGLYRMAQGRTVRST